MFENFQAATGKMLGKWDSKQRISNFFNDGRDLHYLGKTSKGRPCEDTDIVALLLQNSVVRPHSFNFADTKRLRYRVGSPA